MVALSVTSLYRLTAPALFAGCTLAMTVTAAPAVAATLDGTAMVSAWGNTVTGDFTDITSDQPTLACMSAVYPPTVDLDSLTLPGNPFPIPGYLELRDADMSGTKTTTHVLPDGEYQIFTACTPTNYNSIRSSGWNTFVLPYSGPAVPGSADLPPFGS